MGMEKVMEAQLDPDVENAPVMVAAMYTWMKQSRKTSFFVGTAQGSYLTNLLAGLSLSAAAFLFNNFIVPAVKTNFSAVRRAVADRIWPHGHTPSTDTPASDSAITDMYLVELQPTNHSSNMQIQHRRRQVTNYLNRGSYERRTAGPSNLIPSHINDVFIIFSMSDNVSIQDAQNFKDSLQSYVHHLFAPVPAHVILLRGSKLIRARFNLRLVSEEQEQELQAQAKELEDLAEKAMTLDESATLQIGGLTIIHKDEQGQLTRSILPETDVPIISSVTHFPERRELMIEGCFFNGSEFKASTSNQCTNLRVFKEEKLKDGAEVVFAWAPEAHELILDDHTYIYAYKSVLCGKKSVIVRSEGERIMIMKTSPQSSTIGELQKNHTKGTIVILFVILNMLGIGPASSLIVRFSIQLISIAIGYLIAMLLSRPWFMKWPTSKGAFDGGPIVADKGKVVEWEGSRVGSNKGKVMKAMGITRRGTIKKEVMKSLLS